MKLWAQVAPGTNITITFTLQGLSASKDGFTPGNVFNAGNPTETVTIPIPPAPWSVNGPADEIFQNLFSLIEDAIQKGTANAS